MAAYRRLHDSHHLQADCQEPGSAPEPYAQQSSMGYHFYLSGRCLSRHCPDRWDGHRTVTYTLHCIPRGSANNRLSVLQQVMHVRENCDDDDITPILDRKAGDWTITNTQRIYQTAGRLLLEKYTRRPRIVEVCLTSVHSLGKG